MTRSLCIAAAAAALLWAGGGCGDKIDAVQPLTDSGPCPASVTYDDPIEAILARHCTSCHAADQAGAARNGAPAGVDYDTFAGAAASAQRARARINNDTMPPGTPKVSADDKALVACWIDQGLKES